jgi:16S rRNA (cytosine967-C5)-methyltransferase
MLQLSNPRAAAAAMLAAVLRRRRPFDEVLAEAMAPGGALAAADTRDRAFSRMLAATVLRRLGQIDAILAACLERVLPAAAAAEQDLLRLGAAQLLFLGTPAHAAVDSAMQLVRPASRYRGLVNAVLRRIARDGSKLLEGHDAALLNTPAWLWQRWSATYGEDTARRIAAAHMIEPPLDFTMRDAPEPWAALLAATMLPTGTFRRETGGAIETLPGFAEGAWWVQDAAAALPVKLLGAVAGKRVIDLCAAPGGKTAQLAAAGAQVIAVERSAVRLQRLQANLSRLHLETETVIADAAIWRPGEPADAVLLDAPCSATGTIRRHPDVALLKRREDVVSLAATQDRLLAAAATMVRPGGQLVYCVCSLEPEEGPAQIVKLLATQPSLKRSPIAAAEVGGLAELLTADGDLRTLPCHLATLGGMDGFYACRLLRQE